LVSDGEQRFYNIDTSKKISWAFNDENVVPSKIGVSNSFYNPSFVVRGLSYSIYTQGMDELLNKILFSLRDRRSVSDSVKEQLEKISEELKIKEERDRSTHLFFQSRIAGFEQMYSLNKDEVISALQVPTPLNSFPLLLH
jgi:hypothetical protein